MEDTQWPRYQVFLQEEAGGPHLDVGSVHAPDAELALLNARDVFVRRPECNSLWVVPSQAIYSRTQEELREKGVGHSNRLSLEMETYFVFCKVKSAGAQTYVGQIEAACPETALAMAIETFVMPRAPFAWWVLPARSVLESKPGDIPSFFAPARDKRFRMSTDFRVISAMRQIKAAKKETREP